MHIHENAHKQMFLNSNNRIKYNVDIHVHNFELEISLDSSSSYNVSHFNIETVRLDYWLLNYSAIGLLPINPCPSIVLIYPGLPLMKIY